MKKVMLLLLSVMFIACGAKFDSGESSAFLISEGKNYLEQKKYSDAVKAFEIASLNAYNPSEAEESQRLKGYAYYKNKKYVEAIASLEAYLDLYGGTKSAEIYYLIAMSYYKKSSYAGRDNYYSLGALKYFDELINRYPDFNLIPDVLKYRQKVKEKLALADLKVGNFYLKNKNYDSAINRYLTVINSYKDTKYLEVAYENLIKASIAKGVSKEIIKIYLEEFSLIYPENKNTDSYYSRLE